MAANPRAHEVNFDGIVGPTHNYAGLSYGNVASQRSKARASSPRAAALQGLAKMRLLASLGVRQAVLPPHERPDVGMLRRLGFGGSDAQVLEAAQREAPELLLAACSASAMWAANAATVTPSADATDGRVHLTVANLASHFHRSLEPPTTERALRAIFADESAFAVHPALPQATHLGDEGAANHLRLAAGHGARGVEVFVYGRSAFGGDAPAAAGPRRFPARQTLEASRAVARLNRLDPADAFFLRQSPAAIDAGVFHNDVASVANEHVLLYHASAFAEPGRLADVQRRFRAISGGRDLCFVDVPQHEVPLADAVRSYLFNSQLLTLPGDGAMMLVCPAECEEIETTRRFLERLVGEGRTPIASYRAVDVRQSMDNGGGPACLRLRVVLTEQELARVRPGVLFTPELDAALTAWVGKHYRETLRPEDLSDPKLLEESRTALDELTKILGVGRVYEFQA